MASIKVKFRPSSSPDKEGTIFYQILHDSKQRHYITDYHIHPSEWNVKRASIITNVTPERKSIILSIKERIRWDIERFSKIIRHLNDNNLDYSVNDIVDEFQRYSDECSVFNFM